jgi:glutamine synthetase adenylyltransferase
LEFKTGAGGTVDVEFAVQYWLMRQGIFEPNTFRGLAILAEKFPQEAKTLAEGYTFLRRLESVIRLDDNQSHSHLPANDDERGYLARRFAFPSLADFDGHVAGLRQRVREAFDSFFAHVE